MKKWKMFSSRDSLSPKALPPHIFDPFDRLNFSRISSQYISLYRGSPRQPGAQSFMMYSYSLTHAVFIFFVESLVRLYIFIIHRNSMVSSTTCFIGLRTVEDQEIDTTRSTMWGSVYYFLSSWQSRGEGCIYIADLAG